MYLNLVLILLLNFILISTKATAGEYSSKADSFIALYESAKHDTLKARYAYKTGDLLLNTDAVRSLEYLEAARELADKILSEKGADTAGFNRLKLSIMDALGTAYGMVGDIEHKLDIRHRLLKFARAHGDKADIANALANLAVLQQDHGNHKLARKYYEEALHIAEEMNDAYSIGINLGNIGTVMSGLGHPDSCIYYYKRSLPYLKQIKSEEGRYGATGWMMNNIGSRFLNNKNYDSALHYFKISLSLREHIDHSLGQYMVLRDIAKLYHQTGDQAKALSYINRSIDIGRKNGFIYGLDASYKLRSNIYRKQGKYQLALDDYQVAIQLRDSNSNEATSKQALQQTMKYEYEKQQLSDSLAYAQKEYVLKAKTLKQRAGLLALGGGLLLLGALAFSIMRGKKRSDALLRNILPEETARELKQKGHVDAKHFDEVTVLFTDFKDFTGMSERMTAQEMVNEINYCYSEFDRIISKHGIEKIKTIGDAYMCSGGLPVANKTNAVDTVRAALEIRDFMLREKEKRIAEGRTIFEIRIGIHTGPVVAGIVGIKKFAYDIWGNTVNIASRMESSGMAGQVNISAATYELVKDKFKCTYRGKLEAKGKGEIDMYFVDHL